jgi:hypothetical protein
MIGNDDPYWSLDIPGLTEAQANQLLDRIREKHLGSFGFGTAIDPAAWLTLHLDRASVQMLYDGLMSNPETATPDHGLAGDLGAWLRSQTDAD